MDTDLQSHFDRILKNFNSKYKPGFPDKFSLANWYVDQLKIQDFKCYYCDTEISVIRELIVSGLLKPRKVKGGAIRGMVLEIDKKINENGYSPHNCVLACYYCNNDKSNIFDDNIYKEEFGKNRNRYHLKLKAFLNNKKLHS